MNKFYLIVWLMIPVVAGAYHFGPGQRELDLDDVSKTLTQADRSAKEQQWPEAIRAYDEALSQLPADQQERRNKIRLEKAKAQMNSGALPQAFMELQALEAELKEQGSTNEQLVVEVEEAFANAQFYVTWVLRLEGEPHENWEPLIESSRQTYRKLAEQADCSGDQVASQSYKEGLESAIRLARLDLDELQGLPLPAQCKCKGSCSGCCKGKGKKKGRGTGKQPKDARGASQGATIDRGGS